MATETSIIIEFGEDITDDTIGTTVTAEIDDQHEANLDSDGEVKSTFDPEDMPVILIHHGANVQIDKVVCTSGSVTKIGSNKTRVKEDTVTLTSADDDEHTLSYANVNGYNSLEWFGNTANITIEDSLIVPGNGTYPCHGNIEFDVVFQHQYQLIPPTLELGADETYEIVIVIYASIIGG